MTGGPSAKRAVMDSQQTQVGRLIEQARKKKAWTRSDLAREIWGEMETAPALTGAPMELGE